MKVHILQHVPFEGPASIADWAKKRSLSLGTTRLFNREILPKLESFDLLIILGGPMSVNDEDKFPWLREEKVFLRDAAAAGKRMLGICLGAQMLADVLGGRVFKAPLKEIGWFPVERELKANDCSLTRSLPSSFQAFHWHGETFELPEGAIHLARSAACENQAFAYDTRILALQFHLEMTRESVDGLLKNCPSDITPGPYVQAPRDLADGGANFTEANTLMFGLLDALVLKA